MLIGVLILANADHARRMARRAWSFPTKCWRGWLERQGGRPGRSGRRVAAEQVQRLAGGLVWGLAGVPCPQSHYRRVEEVGVTCANYLLF